MQYKNTLIYFTFILLFASCGETKKEEIVEKSIQLANENYVPIIDTGRVEVILSNGKESQASVCRYAYFKLNDSSFVYEENVNKKILEELRHYFNDKERLKLSPKLNVGFFKKVLSEYKKMYEENRFDDVLWGVDENFDIDNGYKNFVVLTRGAYDYSGGAHGNYLTNYYLLDKKTGEEIRLHDALTDVKKVTKIGEKYFRKTQELPPNMSLEDCGFWFEKGFQLTGNFYFSEKGMEFIYNPYEIGPYALGMIEFTIPMKEIAPFLKISLERTNKEP